VNARWGVGTALALLLCGPARAVEPEIGIGLIRVDPVGDGFWYQEAFGPRLNLTKLGWTLGATGSLTARWRWHADVVKSGEFDSYSIATTSDATYDPKNHRCVHEGCGPVASFAGHGDFKGIKAVLDWQPTRQPIALSAGLFTYRPVWYEDTVSSGVAGHVKSETNARTAPVFGVALHHRQVELRLEEFLMCLSNRCVSGTYPPIWRNVTMLSVTYRGR
jgi:hypothetical protein